MRTINDTQLHEVYIFVYNSQCFSLMDLMESLYACLSFSIKTNNLWWWKSHVAIAHTYTDCIYVSKTCNNDRISIKRLKDLKKYFRFPPSFRFLLSLCFVRIIANVDWIVFYANVNNVCVCLANQLRIN